MLTWRDDVEMQTLHERGWSIAAIARHLDWDRKTVRACLNGDRVPGRRTSAALDALGPFVASLVARFGDDPHIWASALFDEVVPLGYGRSYMTFTRQLRLRGPSALRGVHGRDRSRDDRDRPSCR